MAKSNSTDRTNGRSQKTLEEYNSKYEGWLEKISAPLPEDQQLPPEAKPEFIGPRIGTIDARALIDSETDQTVSEIKNRRAEDLELAERSNIHDREMVADKFAVVRNLRSGGPPLDALLYEDAMLVPDTESAVPSARSRRGPDPDMNRHHAIARAVGNHFQNWKTDSGWRHEAILRVICSDLDAEQIDVTPSWTRGEPSGLSGNKVETWIDALNFSKKLVADQIGTSLKMAKREL